MKRTNLFLGLGVIIAALVASMVIYSQLPDQLPTHWNIHGEVDGYMGKPWGAFLMPAIMFLLLGVARILPWLSPKHFEVDTFRETYEFLMILIIVLLGYIHAVMLWAGMANFINIARALVAGIFLFFALLGNVLGKVRRNFWIGIRVPWTLANEQVWNDTHRFAARLYFAGGIIGFIATLIGLPLPLAFALLIGAALVPIVYSLIEYKRLEKQGKV